MPSSAPAAILPVRPTSPADPALYVHNGGHLLPRILRNLQAQGHISRVVLSLSEIVPRTNREILAGWGFEMHVSASDLPQVRLAEVFRDLGLDAALVLTPYGYLLDGPLLARAWECVARGEADAAFPEGVIAAKFCLALNASAAQALADLRDYPVPPFSFPAKLARTGLRLRPFPGLESLAEQFLWELFYAGERSLLPAATLGTWLDATPPDRWHRTESFHKLLGSLHGLERWDDLEEPLARLHPIEPVKRLAMMVNYLRRIRAFIPEGERFLEIGYGNTPLTSCLLARTFASGVAVEPFKRSETGLEASIDLCEFLARRHPGLLLPEKRPGMGVGIRERVAFHGASVEELHLPDASVDFCISRMVFEHVMDPEGLSRELHRILRPGGVMLHEIGFNDHDDLSSINFAFLRHSRAEWATMNKSTNLWRVNDFQALWEGLGFVVDIPWREQRLAPPASLHPSWSGYAEDDLYCYMALVRATKTPA